MLIEIFGTSKLHAFDVRYLFSFSNNNTITEWSFLNPDKYHYDILIQIKMLTYGLTFSALKNKINNIMEAIIHKLYLHACLKTIPVFSIVSFIATFSCKILIQNIPTIKKKQINIKSNRKLD